MKEKIKNVTEIDFDFDRHIPCDGGKSKGKISS